MSPDKDNNKDNICSILKSFKSAADLKLGEEVIIQDIDSSNPSSQRLLEVGFTPGQKIKLLNKSLFNDPLAFAIRGTIIAIRLNEAECLKIKY